MYITRWNIVAWLPECCWQDNWCEYINPPFKRTMMTQLSAICGASQPKTIFIALHVSIMQLTPSLLEPTNQPRAITQVTMPSNRSGCLLTNVAAMWSTILRQVDCFYCLSYWLQWMCSVAWLARTWFLWCLLPTFQQDSKDTLICREKGYKTWYTRFSRL